MCFVPKGFVYLCVEFCAQCHMFFGDALPVSEETSAVLTCSCGSLNAKIVQYCFFRSVLGTLLGRLMCEESEVKGA